MAAEPEIAQIRRAANRLRDARKRFTYSYDDSYRHRYTKEEILRILMEANSRLALTGSDLEVLNEGGKFSLSKNTFVILGNRLLNRPDPNHIDAAKFAGLVLLWGYASQGYGPYRVTRILTSAGSRLGANSLNALKALQENDITRAYECWTNENQIDWIGESFLTKILYFLGKVLSSNDPIAVIKDRVTSRVAADLFGMPVLRNRGLRTYLAYLQVIDAAALVTKLTREQIEETLFSMANPSTVQKTEGKSDELIERGFAFAEDEQDDLLPPVLAGRGYQEATEGEDGVYRIMLVADGKPDKDLLEMTYASERKPLLSGFYSKQRERIIQEANAAANACRQGTPTYVLTTGFGAVALTETINLYNVPGQEAIKKASYWNIYKQSLLRILPRKSTQVRIVVIVYYAGVSKQAFRDGIFSALKQLSDSPEISRNYKIRACMYGATKHLVQRWDNLCRIFGALSTNDTHSLGQVRRAWEDKCEQELSPFFEWF